MKKFIFGIIIIVIFGFLVFNRLDAVLDKSNDKSIIFSNSEGDDVIVNLEFARTSAEQTLGLSGRESLLEGTGMLFIFKEKQIRSFWMKNMNFPLDIIWLDENKIVRISKNLPPEGKNPTNNYSSASPVNYVLEVPAGFCDKYNIKEGATVIYKY